MQARMSARLGTLVRRVGTQVPLGASAWIAASASGLLAMTGWKGRTGGEGEAGACTCAPIHERKEKSHGRDPRGRLARLCGGQCRRLGGGAAVEIGRASCRE